MWYIGFPISFSQRTVLCCNRWFFYFLVRVFETFRGGQNWCVWDYWNVADCKLMVGCFPVFLVERRIHSSHQLLQVAQDLKMKSSFKNVKNHIYTDWKKKDLLQKWNVTFSLAYNMCRLYLWKKRVDVDRGYHVCTIAQKGCHIIMLK